MTVRRGSRAQSSICEAVVRRGRGGAAALVQPALPRPAPRDRPPPSPPPRVNERFAILCTRVCVCPRPPAGFGVACSSGRRGGRRGGGARRGLRGAGVGSSPLPAATARVPRERRLGGDPTVTRRGVTASRSAPTTTPPCRAAASTGAPSCCARSRRRLLVAVETQLHPRVTRLLGQVRRAVARRRGGGRRARRGAPAAAARRARVRA